MERDKALSALLWSIKRNFLKFLSVLVLTILVLTPFMFGCIHAFQITRHVDPARVREEPLLSTGLIAFYSNLVWMAATERYNLTLLWLDRGSSLYIPQNLMFTASRFNSLLQEASVDLRTVKSHIEDAETSLEQGDIGEAEENLEEAWLTLQEVYLVIDNLESAAEHLAELLNQEPYPLSTRILELRDLTDGYSVKVEHLLSLIRIKKTSSSIRLTFWINVTKAALGDFVRVDGVLMKEDGERLTLKHIGIYIENRKVGDAYTDWEGYYYTEIQIPYIYKHQVQCYSLFKPSTQVEKSYPTSRSTPLTIELLYWEPYLLIDEVEPVFPGTKFNVLGHLYLEKRALQGHLIDVTGLGETVSTETGLNATMSYERGDFEVSISVPPDFPEGSYPVVVEAYPKEMIGPTSAILHVKVFRLMVNMEVDAPRIIIAGLTLTIGGHAEIEGVQANDLRVTGRVGGLSSTTRIGKDGSFELYFRIPLTFFTMKYLYTVSTISIQPWISPSSVEGELIVVNPLTLILFFSIAVIATLRLSLPRKRIEVSDPAYSFGSIPQSESVIKSSLKESGDRALAYYYWLAVETISTETDLAMEPNYTIREYLEMAAKKIMVGGKGEDRYLDFKLLSLIFEKSLYYNKVILEDEEEAYKAFNRLVGERTKIARTSNKEVAP